MERKLLADIEVEARRYDSYFEQETSPFLPSEIVSCFYEYPLKILLPDSTSDSCCQWIYPVIFGGGLVEGDNVNISVKVGNSCCVLMATLSFPKVYCCESGFDSQQHVKYDVCSQALLCVLPDPTVCYKKASYVQTQSFHLTPEANVVSLDWFTSGRYERGERWDFSRLKTVSNFYMNKQLVFKEAQQLQNTLHLNLKQSMKSYNVCGTCIIVGPFLSLLFEKILSQLGQCHNYGERYVSDSLFAVSPLLLKENDKPAGCIVRFASESVAEATQMIEDLLEPLLDLIGGNPLRH